MGLSWQQGPLAAHAAGQFLTPDPLPERLLYAEPLRRRLRVRFGGDWIADTEDVVLLHEPGRYPVAYFPEPSIGPTVLEATDHVTTHRDLGPIAWLTVHHGERSAERAAWRFADLPAYASMLRGRVAFAWHPMEAFYEEDERILGHAADIYHRIDIRRTSRHLVVRDGDRVVADTVRPRALYESGFTRLASYYDVGNRDRAAWSYEEAWPEVHLISDFVSFEPDKVDVYLDGRQLALEPGQSVVPHGIDRGFDVDEVFATT